MTSHRQTRRQRLALRLLVALSFTALGVAVAQVVSSTEDEEVQASVEKATVSPIPPVGGPRTAGVEGEVSLGSLRANYTHTDVTVKGVMGAVSFVRRYNMDTLGTTTTLAERPALAPFGTMKADAVGPYRHAAPFQCGLQPYPEDRDDCNGGLRWRHNFDSWVSYSANQLPGCDKYDDSCDPAPQYEVTWKVLDQEGRVLSFSPCSLERSNNLPPLPSCFGRNHEDTDVKLELLYYGSVFGDAFVLHTPQGRYVYAEPWDNTQPPEDVPYPYMVRRRLSYILAPQSSPSNCDLLGPESPCQRRVATLHYGRVCTADGAETLGTTRTYVTSIDVAGGSTLWLDYGSLPVRDRPQLVDHLADGGTRGGVAAKECVLQRLWLSGASDAGAPTGDVPVATYVYAQGPYEQDGGTPTTEVVSGLLSEVHLSAGGPTGGAPGTGTHLRYEYVEPQLSPTGGPSSQPLRTFRAFRDGILERELVMDAVDGAYVKQARVGDAQVNLWADNSGRLQPNGTTPYCHPGRFGATGLNETQCATGQLQHQRSTAELVGNGSGALLPGVQKDSTMVVRHRSPHGPLLTRQDLQCTGATCDALAPLQRSRTWALQAISPCENQSCSVPPSWYLNNVFATSNTRDTRGSFTVYDNQLAPDGVGVPPRGNGYPLSLPPLEVSRVRSGASLADGNDALLTRNFTYTYGPTYQQQVKEESGESALEPTDSYQVVRHHDAATGRLTAVLQRGYTLEFNPTSNSWAKVQRYVGTFYRAKATCTVMGGSTQVDQEDPRGRVVEVAGPCPVADLNAQQCATGTAPVPVTQYEYWPETSAPHLAGRLAVRRTFTRTSASGACSNPGETVGPNEYLETRYEDYDTRGHLTQVRDANNVVTKYLYSGDKLVETRQAHGTNLVAVTTYGYDTGQGTGNWVYHPDGRYEVQCFRTGTTAGCTGGVLTDKLQWRATSRRADGLFYSERTDYTYAANGQLVGETVRDRTGAVRRQRYFEGDPLGRTTYEATGTAAPGPASDSRYHQVSLFDTEGNRVGMGESYQPGTSPLEPLCGGFGSQSTQTHALPASTLCKAFQYDRLNRLTRLMEPMGSQGSEVAVTCVVYDVRGNLARVDRAGASRPCDPGAERQVRYVHDDFGKLVRVEAPWARGTNGLSGDYHYGYDTAGNLVLKQTPAMAHASPATWVSYSYDAMGRIEKAQAVRADALQSPQTLFSYFYDGRAAPPDFCPGHASNPDGSPNVRGRAQVMTDSFGDTWYAYDVHGRPKAHWRVRAQPGHAERTLGCGRANTPNTPNRWFYHDASGRLINEVLPGGRGLFYLHHDADRDMPHRVAEVRITTWDGMGWSAFMPVLKDIQWEPYGGVKSYAINTHLSTGTGTTQWRYVDYLRTAPATVPLAKCNSTGLTSGSDYTGRLKAVTVSTEAERTAGRPGDIFKRVYTWKADQVVREDTCVLDTRDVAPETLLYAGSQGEAGFDMRGQLRHVTGRPHELRKYEYDSLGNRLSERRGNYVFQLGYTPETGGLREEALRTRTAFACAAGDAACATTTPLTSPTESYTYDDDGRLSQKTWAGQSMGPVQVGRLTFGTTLDGPHAALGAVYRSVADESGRTWEYFYDAGGRRRLKLHPSGAAEESFFDKTRMLEDWSVTSLLSPTADSVRDEYIWLDGRVVALFKARVPHGGTRLADFTGTCERHSDSVQPACGVYYPVTDVVGKPVVMLDGAGRVTGVADYDAFGHINRITHLAESSHPSLLDGQDTVLATTSTTTLPAPRTGLSVHVRARFSVLKGGPGSEAFLTTSTNVPLPPATSGGATSIDGNAGLRTATPWAHYTGAMSVHVHYTEAYQPGSEPESAPWGASLEGFEYRRFQTGATPVWLPLRLPGQYHDAETDLFENWNRFYDPSIGRYLGPEPKLLKPEWVAAELASGVAPTPYGYARGNPVTLVDMDGLSAEIRTLSTDPFRVSPRTLKAIVAWRNTPAGAKVWKAMEQSPIKYKFGDERIAPETLPDGTKRFTAGKTFPVGKQWGAGGSSGEVNINMDWSNATTVDQDYKAAGKPALTDVGKIGHEGVHGIDLITGYENRTPSDQGGPVDQGVEAHADEVGKKTQEGIDCDVVGNDVQCK